MLEIVEKDSVSPHNLLFLIYTACQYLGNGTFQYIPISMIIIQIQFSDTLFEVLLQERVQYIEEKSWDFGLGFDFLKCDSTNFTH